MRVMKPTFTRDGQTTKLRKWYVEFRAPNGKTRRVPGFMGKPQTETLAVKIDQLLACRLTGDQPGVTLSVFIEKLPPSLRDALVRYNVIDSRRAAASKPLTLHLEDFRINMEARNNTPKHVMQTYRKASTVIEHCGFQYWSEISASDVLMLLSNFRSGPTGIGVATSNHYLQATKAFCKWMVQDGRATKSPLDYIQKMNEDIDRRAPRRPLTIAEAVSLIRVTKKQPTRYRMTGMERALLYEVAMETGLRRNEAANLIRHRLDLMADPPCVVLEARHSKRREPDRLPLRPSTAARLRAVVLRRGADEPAFPVPMRAAEMLSKDLKAAHIKRITMAGRLDFHSLRHTFGTNLARAGVHPKVAQVLMRHSDINLTMSLYTHPLGIEREVDALNLLPDLSKAAEPDGKAKKVEGA